jgi:hypothetical protein
MLKNEDKVKAMEKILHRYADLIKVIFIQTAAKGDNWPYIRWGAFSLFCIEANIPDKRKCM